MGYPICFSCDVRPQKYIDCLCEFCHQIALAETPEQIEATSRAEYEDRKAKGLKMRDEEL